MRSVVNNLAVPERVVPLVSREMTMGSCHCDYHTSDGAAAVFDVGPYWFVIASAK